MNPHVALTESFQQLQNQFGARLLCRLRSGSHAYGLAGPDSDLDERGIFVLPARVYAGLVSVPNQISDRKNDRVYYSLRRVIELCIEANPNLVELLFTPDDCVLELDPMIQPLFAARAHLVCQDLVRSKLHYAMGQIKKARGHNKWINNPMPESAPTAEQYCYWLPELGLHADTSANSHDERPLPARPRPITELAERTGFSLAQCHVARVEHGAHLYRLYGVGEVARGVFRDAGKPYCESIPKELERAQFIGLLLFNEQAFERAKVDHHNYWRWRTERNDARWIAQERGQLDYDAKNMMHCLRLMYSALAILQEGAPMVAVPAALANYLRAVKSGEFTYQQVLHQAEQLYAQCESLLPTSSLPTSVHSQIFHDLLLQITDQYQQCQP